MRSKIGFGVLGVTVAFLLATNPVVVNAHGLIGSSDIAANAVKSKHVKNNALKGKDIKDNKVTGADVNEATLGVVPNATNLNGLAASTYLNTAYRFRLPITPASTDKTFNLPVPAGTYLVTYNVIATAGGPIRCLLNPGAVGATAEAPSISDNDGGFVIATGSAIVQATGTPSLRCFGASFAIFATDVVSSVNFTKLDVLSTPTATGGRTADGARGGPFTR